MRRPVRVESPGLVVIFATPLAGTLRKPLSVGCASSNYQILDHARITLQ